GARDELEQSLARLGVDHIDLYQFHAVTEAEEVDAITADDGALAAFREAKAEGLIGDIGLTSHGPPEVILDAVDRIPDLVSVMFPMNYVVLAKDEAHDYGRVLERCRADGLGAIGIKAFAQGTWPDEDALPARDRPYGTWYEPYDTQPAIAEAMNFAISRGMDTITNAGDPKLLPMILDAAERFEELDADEQAALIERAGGRSSPVPSV
ncbi:MAG: aldo/keto reductase, partial [Halobacteriales archaeon]